MRTSVALVAVTLVLAVVGVAGSSLAPAVAVANVLGGMMMLALFCRLGLAVRPPPPVAPGQLRLVRGLGFTALGLLALQIALGVLTSAGLAGRTCPSLLSCLDALNVWHGVTAVMLATILLALASAIWRFYPGARTWAGLLIVLTTVEIALGALLIGFEQPLAAAAAHSAIAALMVVAATWAAYQSRPADAAAVSALCQMRTSNQPPAANMQR
jgi:heme A synthase